MAASGCQDRSVGDDVQVPPTSGRGAASHRGDPRPLIAEFLGRQQDLTAVGRFAQRHDGCGEPLQARYYRDLIPLEAPRDGEQYAFEVDLDRCSGCKACVSACHELNGLDEGETWRSVGLLHGGTSALPVLQHVTTACHHCLDPACLYGCPVNAYEKDPVTGIVKHLDDQCIGCQYCIFKCPYDVPKYNTRKGIVRKCDLCSGRLAAGEAPACVQACPTSAIRVTVVDRQAVIEDSEANLFLPGAPEPGYTLPTTVYKTGRALPRNLLPADYYAVAPGHAHLALVWMLVLTQMSVGAFVVDLGLDWFVGGEVMLRTKPIRVVAALLVGLLGLVGAVGHLGRPLYAFRAFIGLRTSWLSREIVAFGLFAFFAAAYCLDVWLHPAGAWKAGTTALLRDASALSGLAGIFCSVMIYVDTRRPFWNLTGTGLKFFLTALVLGLATAVLVALAAAGVSPGLSAEDVMGRFGRGACRGLILASAAKLVIEGLVCTHLRDKKHTPLKRTALLLTGALSGWTVRRAACGVLGGLILPALLAAGADRLAPLALRPFVAGAAVGLSLLLTLAGECLERYLFFTAVVAPKMPGAVTS